MPRGDSNPRPPDYESRQLKEDEALLDYTIYRDEFYDWMKNEQKLTMADDLIRKLDRVGFTKINTIEELYRLLKRDKTKTLRVALRDFFKFLIMTGKRTERQLIDFKAIVKIPRSGIRTVNAFTTTDKIRMARERVRDDPVRSRLLDLIIFGGIRLQEAVDILNNFDESELYVNGSYARYDLLALYKRIGSKKGEISEITKREVVAYMPIEVAKKLVQLNINYDTYKGSDLSFGIVNATQVRKWFSDTLDELGIDEKIISFITGKTPENVLRKHYLQLLKKADRAYESILPKLQKMLEIK